MHLPRHRNANCLDSPNFLGSASIRIGFAPCLQPGETLGGSLTYDFDWDGNLLDAQLSTSDYSYNGIPYLISDLVVEVPVDAPPECSGPILSGGNLCVIIPDCTFCPF